MQRHISKCIKPWLLINSLHRIQAKLMQIPIFTIKSPFFLVKHSYHSCFWDMFGTGNSGVVLPEKSAGSSSTEPSLGPRHLHQLRHARMPRTPWKPRWVKPGALRGPGRAGKTLQKMRSFKLGPRIFRCWISKRWQNSLVKHPENDEFGLSQRTCSFKKPKTHVDSTEIRQYMLKATVYDVDLTWVCQTSDIPNKSMFMSVICWSGLFRSVAGAATVATNTYPYFGLD